MWTIALLLSAVYEAPCFWLPSFSPSVLMIVGSSAKLPCDLGPVGNWPLMIRFQKESCSLPVWRLDLEGKQLERSSSLILRLPLSAPPFCKLWWGTSLLMAVTWPCALCTLQSGQLRRRYRRDRWARRLHGPSLGLHSTLLPTSLSLDETATFLIYCRASVLLSLSHWFLIYSCLFSFSLDMLTSVQLTGNFSCLYIDSN